MNLIQQIIYIGIAKIKSYKQITNSVKSINYKSNVDSRIFQRIEILVNLKSFPKLTASKGTTFQH